MATYIDIRLPVDIEKASEGGLEGLSSVSETPGRRQAVDHWPVPMGSWDIAYGLRELPEHIHVVQAIHAFCRRLHGFGFQDPLNYQLPNAWPETGDLQAIATGDGSSNVFQLVKPFEPISGLAVLKPVRFVDKGLKIAFDGVLQREGPDYTVDYAAGTITSAASAGAMADVVVAAQCTFRFPVFFVDEKLPLRVHTRAAEIPSIELKEAPY